MYTKSILKKTMTQNGLTMTFFHGVMACSFCSFVSNPICTMARKGQYTELAYQNTSTH